MIHGKRFKSYLGTKGNIAMLEIPDRSQFIPNHNPALVNLRVFEENNADLQAEHLAGWPEPRRRHYLMQLINCANPNRSVYHLGKHNGYRRTIEWLLAAGLIRPWELGDWQCKAYSATLDGIIVLNYFHKDVVNIWRYWHSNRKSLMWLFTAYHQLNLR